jgi:hypothetical protein
VLKMTLVLGASAPSAPVAENGDGLRRSSRGAVALFPEVMRPF